MERGGLPFKASPLKVKTLVEFLRGGDYLELSEGRIMDLEILVEFLAKFERKQRGIPTP